LTRQNPLNDDDRDELQALTRELVHGLGLGSRSRAFTDVTERARTAVRKAIKRAIEEISLADPAVGQHFASSVSTGSLCAYRPRSGT
jgi:hypothetical protein